MYVLICLFLWTSSSPLVIQIHKALQNLCPGTCQITTVIHLVQTHQFTIHFSLPTQPVRWFPFLLPPFSLNCHLDPHPADFTHSITAAPPMWQVSKWILLIDTGLSEVEICLYLYDALLKYTWNLPGNFVLFLLHDINSIKDGNGRKRNLHFNSVLLWLTYYFLIEHCIAYALLTIYSNDSSSLFTFIFRRKCIIKINKACIIYHIILPLQLHCHNMEKLFYVWNFWSYEIV